MKKEPLIVTEIIDFFKFWRNPDRVEGDTVPIKEFQLQIYSVSLEFVFKWYVTPEQQKAVSDYTKIEIEGDTLFMSLGEWNIELSTRKEPE